MPLKQNRAWSDHTTNNYNDYDLPKNWIGSDDGFPEKKELSGAYKYPNGEIPIAQGAHDNGLGYADGVGSGNGYGNYASPNAYKRITPSDLIGAVREMAWADEELPRWNDFKANPLYGYGNAPLEFDYSNYDSPLDVPYGQDAAAGYFEDLGKLDQFEQAAGSQSRKDAMAQALTLLRNAQEYEDDHTQWMLGDVLPDIQERAGGKRALYGDLLTDLLTQSAKGRSILDTIPAKGRMSRERNITGQGTGGFIK